jgi:hypothetical protein
MPPLNAIQEEIVLTAIGYLGQKEISGNKGFMQADFEERMKAVGWESGQAWCAYFAELVWKEAYHKFTLNAFPVLDRLFSAMAVKTWNQFTKSGQFVYDRNPAPGDLVIWQHFISGNPDWKGHAGIVIDVPNLLSFISIEGNTNAQGGREGEVVGKKERSMQFLTDNGLRLLGFIHPTEPYLFT